MLVDILNLVTVLRKAPGLQYAASNGVLILMDPDERSVLFAVKDRQITGADIDLAVSEFLLNYA